MRWIVAYDISDDRRRYRAATELLRVGYRIQRSVYECELEDNEPVEVADRVMGVIDEGRDVVHLLPQCNACRTRSVVLGAASTTPEIAYWVV